MGTPLFRLFAPAKVNLSLEVLGRRADGYHQVRTVLQAVDLADELTFEPAEALNLSVDPPGAVPVEDNLVLLAARALQAAARSTAGAALSLRKHIPTSAGLGGGSSDAAAALLGLRRLWCAALSDVELAAIAGQLGSDVPFFLWGGTALGEGRGDRLTPLPQPAECFAVILVPNERDDDAKTRRLYGLLRPEHFADGSHTAWLVNRLRSAQPVADCMVNTFERVAGEAFMSYSAARAAFAATEAKHVLLSGAGPSLFALVGNEAEAMSVRGRLAELGHTVYAVRLLPPWGDRGYQGEYPLGEEGQL